MSKGPIVSGDRKFGKESCKGPIVPRDRKFEKEPCKGQIVPRDRKFEKESCKGPSVRDIPYSLGTKKNINTHLEQIEKLD